MLKGLSVAAAALALVVSVSQWRSKEVAPLKIGYSDWPGWVAWEVAQQKGWFEEAGLKVELVWFEYGPSLEAFAAGTIDAVSMASGDAMVLGAAGRPSKALVINDYSNGNDMVIGRAGLSSIADLKGKKVGVELNLVDHLLLLKALEIHGLSERDVTLVNMPTNDTPQALAAGGVDAIAAWNPVAAQTLQQVGGSKALFTSREVPGLIYDGLFVDPQQLNERRSDWEKVAQVWFRVVDFIRDPATQAEAVAIMSARVGTTPERYAGFLSGTHLLDLDDNLRVLADNTDLSSILGSSRIVNEFNIAQGVYTRSQDPASYYSIELLEALSIRSGRQEQVALAP